MSVPHLTYRQRLTIALIVTILISLSLFTFFANKQKTGTLPKALNRQENTTKELTILPYLPLYQKGESSNGPTPPPEENPAAKTATGLKSLNVQTPSVQMFHSDVFTGSSTITYPIAVPPGRAGLTPNISLTYSSNSVMNMILGHRQEWNNASQLYSKQVGDFGLGWELSGDGSIHRDQISGLFYMTLNGSSFKLIEVDRKIEEDTVIASYRTNPESFLKITHIRPRYPKDDNGYSYKDLALEAIWLPQSDRDWQDWVVIDKSGTSYTFGLSEQNPYFVKPDCSGNQLWCEHGEQARGYFRLFYSYPLREVKDLHGNKITYTYEHELKAISGSVPEETGPDCQYPVPSEDHLKNYPRATRLVEIDYNHNNQGEPQARIKFVSADDRLDKDQLRDKTNKCVQNLWSDRRIGAIEVYFQNNLVRTFRLNPTYLSRGQRTNEFLTIESIDLLNSAGEVYEVSPHFSYYDKNTDLLLSKASNIIKDKQIVSVEYKYSGFDDQKDQFPVYNRQTEEQLYGTTTYRYVSSRKVINHSPKEEFVKFVYEYPTWKADFRSIARAEMISEAPLDWGIPITGFEFIGHPFAKVIQLKKNKEDPSIADNINVINEYSFYVGVENSNNDRYSFYPFTGQAKKEIIRNANGEIKNVAETDFRVFIPGNGLYMYDKELSVNDWFSSPIKERQGLQFSYISQERSCKVDGQDGIGTKSTYFANREHQNSRQYGNITTNTSFFVSGCRLDDQNNITLENAQPHSVSVANYKIFDQQGIPYVTRQIGSSNYTCNDGSDNSIDIDGKGTVCDKAKRVSLVWNLYDDNDFPWGDKAELNELRRTAAFYTFAQNKTRVNSTENPWLTKEEAYQYDRYGQKTSTTIFADYGQVVNNENWQWIKASNGKTSKFKFVSDGVLGPFVQKSTNSLNQTTQISYDFQLNRGNLGLPVLTQDPNGIKEVTSHDGFGRIIARCSAEEVVNDGCPTETATSRYRYLFMKGSALIVERATRDDLGTNNPTYFYTWDVYDGFGNLIQSQEEKENDGQSITVVDYSFNGNGLVKQKSLPHQQTSGGSYHAPDWNQLAENTGVTKFQYDDLGRTVKEISTDQTEIKYRYLTKKGRFGPPSEKRSYVAAIKETINAKNQLSRSITNPLGQLVQVENNLTTNENTHPFITTYQYDKRGFLTDIYDAKNQQENPQYKTHIDYNQAGQKIAVDDPDRGKMEYDYDPQGNLIKATEARGVEKLYAYDQLNRLVEISYNHKQQDETSTTTDKPVKFYYDKNSDQLPDYVEGLRDCGNGIGKLCSVEDQFGFISFFYDHKGRKTIEERFLNTQAMDRFAGVEQVFTDPDMPIVKIQQAGYFFDKADRISGLWYPHIPYRGVDNSAKYYLGFESIRFGYNDSGQGTSVIGVRTNQPNVNYVERTTYNSLGMPTEEYFGNSLKNVYRYWGEDGDPINQRNYRLKTLAVVKSDFDRNQIDCSDRTNENDPMSLAICYKYDSIGNIARQTYPLMSWAKNGDIITQASSQRREIDYYYDDINRLIASVGRLPQPDANQADGWKRDREDRFATRYSYDSANNMKTKCEKGQMLRFSYEKSPAHAPSGIQKTNDVDCVDSAIAQLPPGSTPHKKAETVTTSQSIGVLGLLQNVGHAIVSFLETLKNLPGKLFNQQEIQEQTPSVSQHLTYDPSGNLLNNGKRQITWDEAGRPVKITTDNTKLIFIYNGQGERIAKVVKQGDSVKQAIIYFGDLVEKDLLSGTITRHYYASGKRVAQRRLNPSTGDDKLTFIHSDHLGSAGLFTDADGLKTSDFVTYYPYGNMRYGWDTAENQSLPTDRLYTGQERDKETNLYYYKARYYNPNMGMFISPDTSDESLNRYLYAKDNPLLYTDPTGNQSGGGSSGFGPDCTFWCSVKDFVIDAITFNIFPDTAVEKANQFIAKQMIEAKQTRDKPIFEINLRGRTFTGPTNGDIEQLTMVASYTMGGGIVTEAESIMAEAMSQRVVVDIGAGKGGKYLGQVSENTLYVAVDIAEEELRILKQNYPDINVVVANAKQLPFKSESVDKIVSYNMWGNIVFEGLEKSPGWYEEYARVLKPGGEFEVTLPSTVLKAGRVKKTFSPAYQQYFDLIEEKQLRRLELQKIGTQYSDRTLKGLEKRTNPRDIDALSKMWRTTFRKYIPK